MDFTSNGSLSFQTEDRSMKLKYSFKAAMISTLFVLGGCISGPKDLHQGFAEKLSGDSYDHVATFGGVPILHRKVVARKISGRVLCSDDLTQGLAHRGDVSILEEQKVIASTGIQIDGTYALSAPMCSETAYQLKAISTCGSHTETISFNEKTRTDYDILLRK